MAISSSARQNRRARFVFLTMLVIVASFVAVSFQAGSAAKESGAALELRHVRTLKSDYVINRLAWHPNNKELAVGQSLNKKITIWNTETGKIIRVHDKEAGGVGALAYSPNGNYLAVGRIGTRLTPDHAHVHLYEVDSGELIRKFVPPAAPRGDASDVDALTFSSDARYLAANGYGGRSKGVIYDSGPGHAVTTFGEEGGLIHSLVFSPDSRQLAVGYAARTECLKELRRCFLEGRVELLATSTWKVTRRIPIPSPNVIHRNVLAMAFSPDGKTLATTAVPASDGSLDQRTGQWVTAEHKDQIRVLDAESLQQVAAFSSGFRTIRCVDFVKNGAAILVGCASKAIEVLDATSGASSLLLDGFLNIAHFSLSPDRRHIAVGAGKEVSIHELIQLPKS
jgi:WD40 repeat protein